MNDPYAVLNLPPSAGEAEVRARYLQLVKEFSPDRAPEKFAEIRAAYDALCDPLRLWERRLFSVATNDSIETIIGELKSKLRGARLTTQALLALAEQ